MLNQDLILNQPKIADRLGYGRKPFTARKNASISALDSSLIKEMCGILRAGLHAPALPALLRNDPPDQRVLPIPHLQLGPEPLVIGAPEQLFRSPALPRPGQHAPEQPVHGQVQPDDRLHSRPEDPLGVSHVGAGDDPTFSDRRFGETPVQFPWVRIRQADPSDLPVERVQFDDGDVERGRQLARQGGFPGTTVPGDVNPSANMEVIKNFKVSTHLIKIQIRDTGTK